MIIWITITPSPRALAGSLASFDTSSIANTEGAPLLEENEFETEGSGNSVAVGGPGILSPHYCRCPETRPVLTAKPAQSPDEHRSQESLSLYQLRPCLDASVSQKTSSNHPCPNLAPLKVLQYLDLRNGRHCLTIHP